MRAFTVATLVALLSTTVGTQSQSDARARFEAASVKANGSGQRRDSVQVLPGGRYTAVNISLWDLILTAFDRESFRVFGAPDWINDSRYDIAAKGDDPDGNWRDSRFGPSRLQVMLQQLLADRFHLSTHVENRDVPVYVLSVLREDRSLGPKLLASSVNCDEVLRQRNAGVAPTTVDLNARPKCNLRVGGDYVIAGAALTSDLASALTMTLRRPVIDKTGLPGRYDLDLAWTPDGAAPSSGVNAPSIFTAVREQLGLRLDSEKAMVDVLVIDRVERPTPD